MVLTSRQLRLISLLKQSSSYQTAERLSKKLGVSERTIHSEIRAIKNAGFEIMTKRGRGIALLTEVQPEKKKSDGLDRNQDLDRRIIIMCRLLLRKERITYQGLAEEFYISKTSIKQDLQFIERVLLRENNLNILSDKKGTRLDFSSVEQVVLGLHNFNQFMMSHKDEINSENLVDDIDLLAEYYPSNLVSVCKNVLYTFIRQNVDTISDIYIDGFLSLLIGFVSQLKAGRHIEQENAILDQKQHAFYIANAVKLLHKASLRLDFVYSNGDIEYLSQMLLNYRFEQVPLEKIDNGLVESLVEKVSKALDINFLLDQNLLEKLKFHIPAMIYRLKFHTSAKNPFTEQIKLEFSVTFKILWLAMLDFGQEIGVVFNDDEIAFLTIHFQLSIEKFGVSRKILVVCPTGQVTSELLINRIKSTAPNLDEVEIASVRELEELELTDYDLVLTTVSLDKKLPNVHYISPFIKNDDLMGLFSRSQADQETSQIWQERNDEKATYLPLLNQTFTDKKELIEKTCQALIVQGFIDKEFAESVLERESLGSTELPCGVAVPHGQSVHVKKTFVAFVRNTRKIKWQDYFIDNIFLIGISEEDRRYTRRIISNVYRIINDDKLMRQLKSERDEKEVMTLFYGK